MAELPTDHADDRSALEIFVDYTKPGGAREGIPLDAFVAPLFKLAPRLLEVVNHRVGFGQATMGLTPEEIAEVKRLSGDATIPQP